MKSKGGFTVIELLVVVAITAILIGISVPAIQSVRESARRTQCKNNLRELGLAIQGYGNAHRSFPPGTLGFSNAFEFESNWFNETSPYFWKKAQHTSFLVLLLPYLERDSLFQGIDPRLKMLNLKQYQNTATNWFGECTGYAESSSLHVEEFFCPSDFDPLGDFDVAVASQPVIKNGQDKFAWKNLETEFPEQLKVTSYLGCAGASTGGEGIESNRFAFRGLLRSRIPNRIICHDGLSNTVLCGETIGWIVDGNRLTRCSWFTGGLGRGRANIPWMMSSDPENPEKRFLGTSRNAELFGFGSMHPSVVNVLLGDGAVKEISQDIDWKVWYAKCGAFDSNVNVNRE